MAPSKPTSSSRCLCCSFRTGIIVLFGWELFWLWCWYMTCQFLWIPGGEYNSFNDGGWITRSPPIILFCTFLTFLSTMLTGWYLLGGEGRSASSSSSSLTAASGVQKDKLRRLGLVVSCILMLIIAIVFVIGGVYIMIIDILLMGCAIWKTWMHYKEKVSSGDDGKTP